MESPAFLAAHCSSRSLVVGPLVRLSVCPSDTFVKKVTFTESNGILNLPIYGIVVTVVIIVLVVTVVTVVTVVNKNLFLAIFIFTRLNFFQPKFVFIICFLLHPKPFFS